MVLQKYYKGSLAKMDALDNKKLEEWLLEEGSSNIAKYIIQCMQLRIY